MKAYTCYRLTAVAIILVNREFCLLTVFFECNDRIDKIIIRLELSSIMFVALLNRTMVTKV